MSQIRLLGACGLLLVGAGLLAAASNDEALLTENKISTEGPGLLEYFQKRAAAGADEGHLKALIRQLGDDDFEKREEASRQLVAIGGRSRPWLEKAAKDTDIEVSHRAQDCLRQIEQGMTSAVVAAAARQLARKNPAGAAGALLDYLPAAEDETVAEELRNALATLAVRDGKAEPALVAGLTDKAPVKRAGAGFALAKSGLAGQRDAVRKLLADEQPSVRLVVGLALLSARDKEAVPAVIELLAEPTLSLQDIGVIEDVLYRLAEDKGPTASPGNDPAAMRKYRDAWAGWWKENGARIDLARLSEAARPIGHTTVVLLDQGQVVDLDKDNKVRFQVNGLEFPLDVQYLPGDRVLVAEHNASQVTERNREGKILWKKVIDSPLVAQRLPNGNTMIATRTQVLEFDPKGEAVFTHTRPGGEMIMRAQKLRNGDYALVTQLGGSRFVRLNPAGKEVSGFGVDVRTSGGRIEVLPNGHVLVPENGNNRVVEHDAQGKVVWEVSVEAPIMAVRLANGHTLITSMNPLRGAVEFDRNKREVWQYKSETRVTRAYRR
jgi:hypothetical protein